MFSCILKRVPSEAGRYHFLYLISLFVSILHLERNTKIPANYWKGSRRRVLTENILGTSDPGEG